MFVNCLLKTFNADKQGEVSIDLGQTEERFL